MYKHDKQESLKFIDTLITAIGTRHRIKAWNELWRDCVLEIDVLSNKVEYELDFYGIKNNIEKERNVLRNCDNMDIIISYLRELGELIKSVIPTRLKIAFMPYKASMWDSLETVYDAAMSDNLCDVQVIPLPYYELGERQTLMYEGDKFPNEIDIINYQDYNLEIEFPDIIFVHNIYDNYNRVTRLPEIYHTGSLKACTDMLVYIPYHISSPYYHTVDNPGYAYSLPSIKNVDKVVYCGKFVEDEAIKFGVSSDKILTLGSPKFDKIISDLNKEKEIPIKWFNKIKGKKVLLLNTGCMDFVNDIRGVSVLMELVLDMVRYIDDIVLIWRPHPLTRISIEKFAPENLPIYDMYSLGIDADLYNDGCILDDTTDYFNALRVADILISGVSSITDVFALTGKPILFLDSQMPNNSMLPPEAYYYFYDIKLPWYQFIKKFIKGFDPYKDNRNDIYKTIYENLDGTSGKKIFTSIKNEILGV